MPIRSLNNISYNIKKLGDLKITVGWEGTRDYRTGQLHSFIAKHLQTRDGFPRFDITKKGLSQSAKNKIKKILSTLKISGNINWSLIEEKIANIMILDLKTTIIKTTSPMLRPSTIKSRAKRGGGVAGINKPLIDTGNFLNSIRRIKK